MHPVISEAKIGDKIMRISYEECPESPRVCDNLGTMVCWHSRYDLGDKHNYSIAEFKEKMKMQDMVVLPLYLYDHSGITMNVARNYPFNCRWDSMQVGWIFCTYSKIRQEYKKIRISAELKMKVKDILVSEVATYDQYLRGDICGFEVVQVGTCNLGYEHEAHLDSCWGFYGTDPEKNGMFEHVGPEWKQAEFEDIE